MSQSGGSTLLSDQTAARLIGIWYQLMFEALIKYVVPTAQYPIFLTDK
jgi:hypothetical protein